jgi:hypothetical protein
MNNKSHAIIISLIFFSFATLNAAAPASKIAQLNHDLKQIEEQSPQPDPGSYQATSLKKNFFDDIITDVKTTLEESFKETFPQITQDQSQQHYTDTNYQAYTQLFTEFATRVTGILYRYLKQKPNITIDPAGFSPNLLTDTPYIRLDNHKLLISKNSEKERSVQQWIQKISQGEENIIRILNASSSGYAPKITLGIISQPIQELQQALFTVVTSSSYITPEIRLTKTQWNKLNGTTRSIAHPLTPTVPGLQYATKSVL